MRLDIGVGVRLDVGVDVRFGVRSGVFPGDFTGVGFLTDGIDG